jgi:hypothetical protein
MLDLRASDSNVYLCIQTRLEGVGSGGSGWGQVGGYCEQDDNISSTKRWNFLYQLGYNQLLKYDSVP